MWRQVHKSADLAINNSMDLSAAPFVTFYGSRYGATSNEEYSSLRVTLLIQRAYSIIGINGEPKLYGCSSKQSIPMKCPRKLFVLYKKN